ncbi:molybdopterin adenylyltransferase [Chromobacterium subtsugae]|uniref:Molybdopterin adenylyltransferase n=1 Tax=Chromobacterium subtsugae TaxID=251747 RepID=A0ABS7FAQ7_9NEIS|nr:MULTISPECIES: molybdopterin adenylyltransferase [Chromobacterium]KUM02968.1 molybdenum cofactor biosynthesis protein MogA [Chromobacterium subtsugae]KZE87255.1 molybdopterin adenylyltransferase [Chromobacterium sp. F49]MBW7565788.1 molybdopterin adenylyltransferase [Chromobacterium subtsugae]MBW8287172.1 molybdopterin adenylyltransferase [Chromobacterium subtsugae]OBU88082.1 molybdenum cofactor biosynthesis protein MogA [Chromobacterium subtsugae]
MLKIGLVSISDRASQGVYQDKGLPALQDWLARALATPFETVCRLIPDEQPGIEAALKALVDDEGCQLVLTTGGTGPAPRDVTPDATLAVADREMPGFGEQMRQISLRFVPTAILSRQTGVIRKQSLILNLPGQPKAIQETLEGLRRADGSVEVPGIFAAVPYCLDLIGAPYIETHETVVKAFRPKSAIKPAP